MKIAFVTTYDAQDINSWSGTPYYMSKAFKDAGISVDFIGNLKPSPNYFSFKLKAKFYNDIIRKKFGVYHSFYEPKSLKHFSRQVEKKLEVSDADIVLSPGALPIAYLNTNKPIIMWSDATFAAMLGYYPGYFDLNQLTVKNCNQYEKNVLGRAALSCFSSAWAAESAIKYYNADPEKIISIPYGANLQCEREINDIVNINEKKSRTICELLFVGQEWERKGADKALKITEELNKNGLKTILHLVGLTKIPVHKLPDFVINYGFINKASPEGIKKLDRLFSQSHFFILPTKADCTPMVFAEANSFGLPIITCNTGGVSSIITDNINGKMFDPDINIEKCVEYIKDKLSDIDKYNSLSVSSFNAYDNRLNWRVSVNKIISHIEGVLTNNSNPT